jgi:hypothetical protein
MEEKQFIKYIVSEGKISKGASKAEFQNYDTEEDTPVNIDKIEGDI